MRSVPVFQSVLLVRVGLIREYVMKLKTPSSDKKKI